MKGLQSKNELRITTVASEVLIATALAASALLASSHVNAAQSTTYTYDSAGRVLSIDGPRTDLTDVRTFTYDPVTGDRTSSTNALGQTVYFTAYDGAGRVLSMTDANGVVTVFAWHPRGWLASTTVKDPLGNSAQDATTAYTYNAQGKVTQVTRPNGEIYRFEYDISNRLTAIESALGERIEYTLDLAGNRTQELIKDEHGAIKKSFSRTFDELSRVISTTGAGGQLTQFSYDLNGNLTQITDARSNVSAREYDALDRLKTDIDADLNNAVYTFDAMNRINAVTDQRALTTHYTYDGYGNLTEQNSPDTGVTSFVYDDAGNLVSETDARGVIKQLSYDALNRLTAISYPASPSKNISYDYDDTSAGNFGVGRLTGIADELGFTFYKYDHRGNVVEKTADMLSHTFKWQYAYDLNDQLQSLRYPNGAIVRYERDAEGRIAAVYHRSWEGAQESLVANTFQYLPFGPLQGFSYGNGIDATFSFDQDYQIAHLDIAGTSEQLDRTYVYDATGNIVAINNALDSAKDQSFSYDALSRLNTATGLYGSQNYQYDGVGNRTSLNLIQSGNSSLSTYSYAPDSNRLLGISVDSPAASHSFSYDSAGNMVSDSRQAFTLDYGEARRLNGVNAAQLDADYQYNSLGQRIRKTITANGQPAQTSLFAYDEAGNALSEHQENGLSTRYFVYAGSQRLMVYTPDENADSDGDGLDDDWEQQFFGDLSQDASSDPDGDGLSNFDEFISGELPTIANTPGDTFDGDGDGLRDSWELLHFGTLLLDRSQDIDSDGLSNGAEYDAGTNPGTYVDSDGDGLDDNWELLHFGNLLASDSQDYDLDGLSNLNEFLGVTNPLVQEDGDTDGMPDHLEFAYFASLARDGTGDFDMDGISDIDEINANSNPRIKDSLEPEQLSVSQMVVVLGGLYQ